MPIDDACVEVCAEACVAILIAVPPPLDAVLIAVCGAACLVACNSDTLVSFNPPVGPEFPFEPPADTEI